MTVASSSGLPRTRADVSLLRATMRIAVLLAAPSVLLPLVIDWSIGAIIMAPWLESAFSAVGLGQYNTRVVVLGTLMLGAASGVIGSFALLRKRALIGDVLSHAMLPGIALAFIIMVLAGGSGKAIGGLLLGAVVFGLLGLLFVLAIRHTTRLKEDAAMGIVLSVFFGLGIALLGVVQKMKEGNAAGLESFIYGKTASMLMADAKLIAMVGSVACWWSIVLFKEFAVLCFDQDYSSAQGRPALLLDVVMLGLLTAVTVIGLQAVGLILMVALLIIPAAAARFWTDRLTRLVVLAAVIGGLSGVIGAATSAQAPKLPAGAIIVVVAGAIFFLSLLFGARRGVLRRVVEHFRLRNKIAHQHLLRAMYEGHEAEADDQPTSAAQPFERLERQRSWSAARLRAVLRRARGRGLVEDAGAAAWRLTEAGIDEGRRITRNHRLWELYLITYADIAPSHVDRDADLVEHVLGHDLVAELERLLPTAEEALAIPPSPHDVEAGP